MCKHGTDTDESSNSEDENYIKALREATDQQFLKHSLFNDEEIKLNTSCKSDQKNEHPVKNVSENCDAEKFQNHGLSQSSRNFIAKKLSERLDMDIILENKCSKKNVQKNVKKSKGIKLLNSSKTVLTKNNDTIEFRKSAKRKNSSILSNEKEHLLKCKEVAIDTEEILLQHDTLHWTSRKTREPFIYNKLKNGTLSRIK